MPLSTLVSAPGLHWDYIGFYPWPRWDDNFPHVSYGSQSGRVLEENFATRENEYRHQSMIATNAALAGADYALRSTTGGPPYLDLYDAAGGGRMNLGLNCWKMMIANGAGPALAAGAQWSTAQRVSWLKWLMRSDTAAPEMRCGLLCMPISDAGAIRWPDNVVGNGNRGGFGFAGDGAGQWQYASYNRAGVSLLRENVALPVHVLTEWNMFEIVAISDRVGLPATVQFWFNGALILTRNWAGALLEPYAANEWRYLPMMSGGSAAGVGGAQFSSMEFRRGQYDSLGTAL